MTLRVDYDCDADALYVTLREATCTYTRSLGELRTVDYASDGAPVGVEWLRVSQGVDLADVPNAEEIGDALRGAFRAFSVTPL
jgi:uncharacterized protein YuzE